LSTSSTARKVSLKRTAHPNNLTREFYFIRPKLCFDKEDGPARGYRESPPPNDTPPDPTGRADRVQVLPGRSRADRCPSRATGEGVCACVCGSVRLSACTLGYCTAHTHARANTHMHSHARTRTTAHTQQQPDACKHTHTHTHTHSHSRAPAGTCARTCARTWVVVVRTNFPSRPRPPDSKTTTPANVRPKQ
jgi:hypothetical protein